MSVLDMIRIAIIDEDEDDIFALIEHLGSFPEIKLLGCATKYEQAKKLLLKENLDLVFIDIEMCDRRGFELLKDVQKYRNQMFSVIICTTCDNFLIQGLRSSALDYILKPMKKDELRNAIDRFICKRNSEQALNAPIPNQVFAKVISLPTPRGLRFVKKDSVVFFQHTREQKNDKPNWSVFLTDMTEVKLRTGMNAKEALDLMGKTQFIQINQSAILNINYLGSIDFRTRDCQLIPPYAGIKLNVSRISICELRNRYDTL